jgi:CO/xanthine dehydrogenase Mo-binding subunit
VSLPTAPVAIHVGRSLPRVEDAALLTGSGHYIDDLAQPGQLCARIVRSEVAHGRLRSVTTDAALALPGIVAVVTARDIPGVRIPVRMLPSEEAKPVTQPPLAAERVRYVGEPVAVVVATDPYRAEDAAATVEVDIEPLAPMLDAEQAAQPDSTPLHAEAISGNVINRVYARHGENVEQLLATAAVVVRDRLTVERQAATPLETRGLLAEFDPERERLTVWGPTKVKHFNRTILSGFLELPESSIRFIEPDVGGGFGARGEFYPEDFLIPWLAIRLRQPVKWVEDRREHFLATNHSRQVSCSIELGVSEDGDLLAFRARCLVDQGAYARTHGTLLLPWILMRHLGGPYCWRGFEIEATSVLTNKTPSGTYRGPSQYEAAFFRERMVDRAAVALGVDPARLRRRNMVPVESMPFRVDLGEGNDPVVYDAGDFGVVLDTMLARSEYDRLVDEAARRREAGEAVGVGLSAHVEEAAFGRYEYARIVPMSERRYVLYVGVASLGQGVRTAMAQILADQLQVPFDWIEVVHQDTDLVPQGFGAYASRTTVVGGGAVVGAAADLRRRALDVAAERLEISTADLEILPGGVIRPRGQPSGGLTLAELGCEGSFRYEQPSTTFDMGAMLALVRVEPCTHAVKLLRLVICQDVGQMVNPQIVDGQVVGGAAQGIAGTLLERFAYDEAGQPLVTSFMDYLMPTAAEIPPIDTVALELPHHDPATAHPLGVKGCGEGGVVGAGAAIANAVSDALGTAARVTSLPLRPDVVREICNAGRRTES